MTKEQSPQKLKQIDKQHRFKVIEHWAHFISRLTNPVFLALFYFVIFTPFALIYRLMSSQSFKRKEKKAQTAWVNAGSEPIELENQF